MHEQTFSAKEFLGHGVTVDVTTAKGVQDFMKQDHPSSVSSVDVVDKNTIRIAYIPRAIGVRDLLNDGFGQPMDLAHLHPDQTCSLNRIQEFTFSSSYDPRARIEVGSSTGTSNSAWIYLTGTGIQYSNTHCRAVVPDCAETSRVTLMVGMDLLIVLSTSTVCILSVVSFGFLVNGNYYSSDPYNGWTICKCLDTS